MGLLVKDVFLLITYDNGISYGNITFSLINRNAIGMQRSNKLFNFLSKKDSDNIQSVCQLHSACAGSQDLAKILISSKIGTFKGLY